MQRSRATIRERLTRRSLRINAASTESAFSSAIHLFRPCNFLARDDPGELTLILLGWVFTLPVYRIITAPTMGWLPINYFEKTPNPFGNDQKSEVFWLAQVDETPCQYIHHCSLTVGLECFQYKPRIFRTFKSRNDPSIVMFPERLKLTLGCSSACFPLQKALEARQARPRKKAN